MCEDGVDGYWRKKNTLNLGADQTGIIEEGG